MTVALRMTGALIVSAGDAPPDPYARVVFGLADGRQLRYRDVRKFGRIGLWPGGGLRSIGGGRGARSRRVEGVRATLSDRRGLSGQGRSRSSGVQRRAAGERMQGRSAKLKSLLLDQSFIAGVGKHLRRRSAVASSAPPAADGDSLDALT